MHESIFAISTIFGADVGAIVGGGL